MADSPLLFACGINFSYQLGIDEEECNGSSSGWPTVTLSREASSMEEKGAGTSVSGGMRRQPSEAPPSHAGGCLQWDARDICDSIHRLPKQLPLDWLDMQVAGRPAAIAAGAHHSVLMTERGSVYLWGFHAGKVYPTPQPAPFGIPLKCVQIACGRKHTLLLMEGGFVMTFGIGYFGQLGHGDSASYGRPRLLRRLDPQRLGDRVVELAGGGYHSAARMRGGAIMAWGFNRYGQCGNGDKESTILEPSPCRLEALGSDSPAQIVCGRHHCAVMTRSGAVYSWGACGFGRLGVADMSQKVAAAPTLVPYFNKSPAAALATGDFHMLALGRDGGVYSWGYSQEGQGGHGGTLHLRLPRLLEFFRDKAVTQVACGAWSSHAVTADGTAYAWGSSDGGWTGLPLAPDAMVVEPGPAAGRHIVTRSFDSDHNCLVPQRVATLEDFAVRQLACGGGHMLALAAPRTAPPVQATKGGVGGAATAAAATKVVTAAAATKVVTAAAATKVVTAAAAAAGEAAAASGATLPPWALRALGRASVSSGGGGSGGAGGGAGAAALVGLSASVDLAARINGSGLDEMAEAR